MHPLRGFSLICFTKINSKSNYPLWPLLTMHHFHNLSLLSIFRCNQLMYVYFLGVWLWGTMSFTVHGWELEVLEHTGNQLIWLYHTHLLSRVVHGSVYCKAVESTRQQTSKILVRMYSHSVNPHGQANKIKIAKLANASLVFAVNLHDQADTFNRFWDSANPTLVEDTRFYF